MSPPTEKFDSMGFFKALQATALARGLRWKDVSQQTGIGASTLSRMAQGRGPDAASQAILAAWSGLNPADFTKLAKRSTQPEPLALLTSQLRNDPRLSPEAANMLDQLIQTTYQSLTERK